MPSNIDKLIELAIEEDIGVGDITTDAIISPNATGVGRVSAKQDLIVAGMIAAERVYEKIDSTLEWESVVEDGDRIEESGLIAKVSGSVASILKGERIVLNFLQHLSGIATFTNLFVQMIQNTSVKILDTRKTKPGYRELEKEAVKLGDGENHRMGLYDRYMIKDNHIEAAGSITEAVRCVREHQKEGYLIEVETKGFGEIEEALEASVDIILLDNFSPRMISKAISIIGKKSKIEVSGNITIDNIQDYALSGVDYISIGALTHSAPAADIHMTID